MVQRQRDTSLGNGVYFAASDYVGLGPRIVILLVDFVVMVATLWLFAFLWVACIGGYFHALAIIEACLLWLYSVPLKRSQTRTIGYRLAGCRIVNLKGQKPSLFALTLRSLLWLFGPCNLLFDLVWCGVDDDRQTMRDRFSGTCLVKNSAVAIGPGEVHLTYFNAFGYSIMYPRVVHPQEVDSNAS